MLMSVIYINLKKITFLFRIFSEEKYRLKENVCIALN